MDKCGVERTTTVARRRPMFVRAVCISMLLVLAAFLPSSVAGADAPVLEGTVGTNDAFVISLVDASGARVTHLDPGTYTIVVHDRSAEHNFHLTGPGVDKSTDVETTANTTWDVTVTDGTYRFLCDAHPTSMRGSFTAGTVTSPPPPPKKLVAQVGPRRTISVRTTSGARVKRLTAGVYKLTVKDLTKVDNFHLIALGINRKTGVKFRGTRTWTVTFRAGVVKYRSDAHRRLRGSFTVVAA
jgi:plastocyanin